MPTPNITDECLEQAASPAASTRTRLRFPPCSGWLLSIDPKGLCDRPLLTITAQPGMPGIGAHIGARGDLFAWVHSCIGGQQMSKPITPVELAQLLGWQVPLHLRGAL